MNNFCIKKYKSIIGLEVHLQLLTKSKFFSSELNNYTLKPNKNIDLFTLAHPGVLPSINKKAIEFAIKMGLMCYSDITKKNFFDRKNYFYPDMAKGYQITQNKTPICRNGYISINNNKNNQKKININRIQLEEDSGKLIHDILNKKTLINFNRGGIPLIEIITDPIIKDSDEACLFLTEIRKIIRYLEICNDNMEEGALRCDVNISLMLKSEKIFGKKVEIKNINSIKNVKLAIEHEIKRQFKILQKKGKITSETRHFNALKNITISQREKEGLNDYRYFMEPDLSPVVISSLWINAIKKKISSLPINFFNKFLKLYNLSYYNINIILNDKNIVLFFDKLCNLTFYYKSVINWIIGPIKLFINKNKVSIENIPIQLKNLIILIELIELKKISFSFAYQNIYFYLLKNYKISLLCIIKKFNLIQENNNRKIIKLINILVKNYIDKIYEYCNGKKGIFGMLVGITTKDKINKINLKKISIFLKKKINIFNN